MVMHSPVETLERPLDLANLVNVWDFYPLDEDMIVPCPSARRFLMLLLSRSTRSLERTGLGVGVGKAELVVFGSMTDDEGHLSAFYTLTRGEVEVLSHEERMALRDRIRTLRVGKDPSGIMTRKCLDTLGLPRVS